MLLLQSDDVVLIALLQSPRATQKEIKQAYYNIMRSCHPDIAGASMSADEEDDGSADDVCAFINAAVMEVSTTPAFQQSSSWLCMIDADKLAVHRALYTVTDCNNQACIRARVLQSIANSRCPCSHLGAGA